MNKEQLKAELEARGIEYSPEATNKELTALLKAAQDAEQPEGEQSEQEEIKPSVIDEKAKAELEKAKPAVAPKGITEEEIKEKTSFGLSRKQAIEILEQQAAHDAATGAAEKTRAKRKPSHHNESK